MQKPADLIKVEFQEYLWRALQVFNIYRLVLTIALIMLHQLSDFPKMIGQAHPSLYLWVISLYFLFALVVILLLIIRKPGYKTSVIMQLCLDIAAVVAIIYSSGGVNNGLGVLLAVSVGVSSLLIGSRRALAVPTVATLALLSETLFAQYFDGRPLELTSIGFLAASIFIIAFLSLTLAKRLHYSEMRAIESKADLESMQAVNQDIIQTMKSGVLVIDDKLNIQLMNDAAWKEIGMPSSPQGQPLKMVCRQIYLACKQWLSNARDEAMLVHLPARNVELQLSFRKLGEEQHNLILIFLEDTTKLTQQAQQLKLSSLGRLTASIAHEIRNPLGAISHAAQLLQESEQMVSADRDLCTMITRHSKRMNNIIENVLNLSQHRPPQQEEILLINTIEQISTELIEHNEPKPAIDINIEPASISVLFDRSQLIQIINNLVENGLRYSLNQTGKATIKISGGLEYPSANAYLDIIDMGPGIDDADKDKIFEPFYTTSEQGTGLGLYLARELCESNGARLSYMPVPNSPGSCFRIQFG